MLVQVNCHSFTSRLSSLQTPGHKLPPLSHTQPFCFQFSRNEKTKKKSCIRDYFLPASPAFPFKYGYSFTRLKQTHYIGRMELKKNWISVKYEEPITMVIKTEHSFVHLRVPKISLELWLNSSSKIRGGSRRYSPWTRSMKGSMD